MAEHVPELAPLGTETYRKICEEGLAKSRSNAIPDSTSERLSLRSLVNTTRQDLQKCTDEIIALQLLQSQLTKTLAYQETLLSPFRKLPSEIMILIFILATADRKGVIRLSSYGRGNNIGFRCTGEIFPLTWVCYGWRQIILSNPSFWTSFKIWTPAFHPSNLKLSTPMINCLDELLLRLGAVSLMCLDLNFSGGNGSYPVLDVLVEHSSRWQELNLVFDNCHRAHILEEIRAQNTGFTNLKVLGISDRLHDFEHGFFETTFNDCPRLHSLNITSFHTTEVFDLQHLTTLRIGTCIGPSFATLLQRCPVLKSFHLHHSITNSSPRSSVMVPPPSIVHHSHLKILRVDSIDERFCETFWENVSLPNLVEVRACIKGIEDQSRFKQFKQMLVNSQCILEQLDLLWYQNRLRNPLESLVEGIQLGPETHTHCISMDADARRMFEAVPAYQKPCSYCRWSGS